MKIRGLPGLALKAARDVKDRSARAAIASKPYADRALEWGRQRQQGLAARLPNTNQMEVWVNERAEQFGWRDKPVSTSLEHLERTLTQVVSAIRQTSDRRTRIFVKAVTGKLGGIVAVGGVSGLVGTFGAASTGTAIASLSGAAATSAQLYWIGSLVGLGAVGGGVLLAAGGVGAGLAAGVVGKKKLVGTPRTEAALQEHEKAILVACVTLISATGQQRELGLSPSQTEMRMVAEQALIPLAQQINQYWDDASLKENGKSECEPFTRTLAYLQRRKLDRCRKELGRISMAAMTASEVG